MFCEDERDELEDLYQIQEVAKIGEGSFGKVFKAIDLTDSTLCAVKVMSKQVIKNAALEQAILQSLDHPLITKFKRLCESKTNIYMIMELLEGGSLSQYIYKRREDPLTDEESSSIMKGLLNAVQYIHSKQIIHRDLKPENILMSNQSDITSIKIADFGLSFQLKTDGTFIHLLSQKCGTMLYMAPEQVSNHQYGKPVDLWSCGIIMYMLLTMGIHPLYLPQEDTKEQLIEKILNPEWHFTHRFSTLAINFFQKLTMHSQSERYNVGQALLHPWITRQFEDEIPMTFDERRAIFDKEQRVIQLLKAIVFAAHLFKQAFKIERVIFISQNDEKIQNKQIVKDKEKDQEKEVFNVWANNIKTRRQNDFKIPLNIKLMKYSSFKMPESSPALSDSNIEEFDKLNNTRKSRFNDISQQRRRTQQESQERRQNFQQQSRNLSVRKGLVQHHRDRSKYKDPHITKVQN